MLLDKDKFRRKVDRLQNLPTAPDLLDKFNEMVNDPSVSMGKIGEMVSQDQILAMKILKLVNSAFYGFPGRISTVTHALVLLGYDVIKGLILSATAFEAISEKWTGMWTHSLGVSKACGIICDVLKIPDAEEVGMAGLLHDIGKVIFFTEEPDIYQKILLSAAKHNLPMIVAEQKLLGLDHTEVAGWLCDRWNLPQKLAAPMTYHHNPTGADTAQRATAVVFLANNVIKAFGYGVPEGAKVEPVPDEIVEMLKIDHDFLVDLVNRLEKELQFLIEE